MNASQIEKLSKRTPVNSFYKSYDELFKIEFPLIYEEYFNDGSMNISKFMKDYDGMSPMLFVVESGFVDSAMGYHHVSSLTKSLDSE